MPGSISDEASMYSKVGALGEPTGKPPSCGVPLFLYMALSALGAVPKANMGPERESVYVVLKVSLMGFGHFCFFYIYIYITASAKRVADGITAAICAGSVFFVLSRLLESHFPPSTLFFVVRKASNSPREGIWCEG